ncbi:Uncharacterised protein [uncultured Clostridium sp.]|uniref:hypothetical protein n=1 Tax=uncultured Clostridium sp. TaxID=59620 RepID=UPI000821E09E|nr:hypothetical protein [uncultured Clostridium sp.]SCJ60262.1 Uncharacterised protein [uncultured Clostridium sp.]
MDVFKILNNNTDGLTDEEKVFAEQFNYVLREKIMNELVGYEISELINNLESDKELFEEKIENIFINGKKGYKDMPTKTLIDIYLSKMNEGDFISLIESISSI